MGLKEIALLLLSKIKYSHIRKLFKTKKQKLSKATIQKLRDWGFTEENIKYLRNYIVENSKKELTIKSNNFNELFSLLLLFIMLFCTFSVHAILLFIKVFPHDAQISLVVLTAFLSFFEAYHIGNTLLVRKLRKSINNV